MNLALLLIFLLSLALIAFEVRAIRREQLATAKLAAWPQFDDTYISALQSGISIADAFSFANDFELPLIGGDLKLLVGDLDRGVPLVRAVESFRQRIALSQGDLFAAIVVLAQQTGGQNLVQALTDQVAAVRAELAANGDVRARQSAILGVAKLGLLAPWILVGVLSVNEQTRLAFNSVAGNLILMAGFGISFLAYRLIIAAGRLPGFKRFLGAVYA